MDTGCILERKFGRQPQLITPENDRGDNANYPSPPTYTFFDDPEDPFGPQGSQPPTHVDEPHEPPDSHGLPPGWPPAPQLAGGRERVGTGNKLRERLHPRPSLPEPQLIPVPMGDGEDDDDQPPQGETPRQRSRSREREIHTNKWRRNHKFNLWLLQNLMMRYQMKIL